MKLGRNLSGIQEISAYLSNHMMMIISSSSWLPVIRDTPRTSQILWYFLYNRNYLILIGQFNRFRTREPLGAGFSGSEIRRGIVSKQIQLRPHECFQTLPTILSNINTTFRSSNIGISVNWHVSQSILTRGQLDILVRIHAETCQFTRIPTTIA